MSEFTLQEYRKIIKHHKHRVCDFYDSLKKDQWTILRHDVEFVPNRAFELAKIEKFYGVSASYVFQVRSNAYNIFSARNKHLIKNLRILGAKIGLHVYVGDVWDWRSLEKEIQSQRRIFEDGLEMHCDRFSFHRPPPWVLENRTDFIGGMLNMYGPSFFEYHRLPIHIKYIADSRHQWNYGDPYINHERIQLNMHVDEWSDKETNHWDNIKEEHAEEFINTLHSECTPYK